MPAVSASERGLQNCGKETPTNINRQQGQVRRLFRGSILAAMVLLAAPVSGQSGLTVESSWSTNPCPPGKPLRLTLTCRWEGDAQRFAIPPPQLDLPEGILKQAVSSRSFREGDSYVLCHQWELTAPERAAFPPIPIGLTIFTKGEHEPSDMEIETESLVVDVSRWKGIPITTIACSVPLVLALSAGLVFLLIRRRSQVRRDSPPQEADPALLLASLKEELNTSRIRGEALAFLKTALRICEVTTTRETSLRQELESLAEQVQYGDLGLSGEEMEKWHQRLKRLGTG